MARDRGGVEGNGYSRPDPGTAAEAEELVRQVRERVERRRATGSYAPRDLDDVPFSELALRDDLAASANRLAAAAEIEGMVPDFYGLGPHEPQPARPRQTGEEFAQNGDPDSADEAERRVAITSIPSAPEHPLRVVVNRGSALARRAIRAVVGERVDRFLERSLDYFAEAAHFAELATRRILELEARVSELEEALAASGPRSRRRGASERAGGSTTSGGSGNSADAGEGGHDMPESGGRRKRGPSRPSTSESKGRKP